MAAPETPQIYLLSPPLAGAAGFCDRLAAVLDAHDVACFRLTLSTESETEVLRAADRLRETCHARDVPIVIDRHFRLAPRAGLDGCHLGVASLRHLREARKLLGPDGIVGAHCGTSRHAGLTAAEAGADYVAFGPLASTALGSGETATHDLFAWWSEMIEVPVVAEGGLTLADIESFAPVTDFFAIGSEIWSEDDPVLALAALMAPL